MIDKCQKTDTNNNRNYDKQTVKRAIEKNFDGPNQLKKFNNDKINRRDLLDEPKIENAITENGVRENLQEGIEYMAYWLFGTGASVVNYLMADVATCEVSRAQLWVWLKYEVKLDDGRIVNKDLVDKLISEELNKTKKRVGDEIFKKVPFEDAAKIFREMITKKDFDDFLTLPLYEKI